MEISDELDDEVNGDGNDGNDGNGRKIMAVIMITTSVNATISATIFTLCIY